MPAPQTLGVDKLASEGRMDALGGWASARNNGTLALVGGALRYTSAGATGGLTHPVPLIAGTSYRISIRVSPSASSGTLFVRVSGLADLNGYDGALNVLSYEYSQSAVSSLSLRAQFTAIDTSSWHVGALLAGGVAGDQFDVDDVLIQDINATGALAELLAYAGPGGSGNLNDAFYDPDATGLTFAVSGTSPFETLDAATGAFTLKTSGSGSFTVTATNGSGSTPDSASFDFGGSSGVTLVLGVEDLAATAYAPTLRAGALPALGLQGLSITTYAPALRAGSAMAIGVEALTATSYAPAIRAGALPALGVEDLTITGYAPVIDIGWTEVALAGLVGGPYAVTVPGAVEVQIVAENAWGRGPLSASKNVTPT